MVRKVKKHQNRKKSPGKNASDKKMPVKLANRKKSSIKKKKSKTTVSSQHQIAREIAKLTTKLNQSNGCLGLTWITEKSNSSKETIYGKFQSAYTTCGKSGVKKAGGTMGRSPGIPSHLSEVLSAVSHPLRLRILIKLLDGPAIYKTLRKLTKLEAGPLYHHIHQLRLAGLILPKQRDLYELTRGGRNAIVAVMSMGSITRDRRRRTM